jgi:hypothetical protein
MLVNATAVNTAMKKPIPKGSLRINIKKYPLKKLLRGSCYQFLYIVINYDPASRTKPTTAASVQ